MQPPAFPIFAHRTSRHRVAVLLGVAILACAAAPAEATSNPVSAQVRIQCGVLQHNAKKGVTIPRCDDLKAKDGWIFGRIDWLSGGQVLFSENGPFLAIRDAKQGQITAFVDGNGDPSAFRAVYLDPDTSVFTRPDLSFELWVQPDPRKPAELAAAQPHLSEGSALWARHSEDGAAALSKAADAQVAADAARGSIADEVTARAAALASAVAAVLSYIDLGFVTLGSDQLVVGRKTFTQLVSGTITSAIDFLGALSGDVTGTQGATLVRGIQGRPVSATPPQHGDTLVWDGAQWVPGSAPFVSPLVALDCPAGDLYVSMGGGEIACRRLCSGALVDPVTNPSHCGACGHACVFNHATGACAGGACVIHQCVAGFADCDGAGDNGCEATLSSDSAHCGACGNACGAGRVCIDSQCVTNPVLGPMPAASEVWSHPPLLSATIADPVTGKYYFFPGYGLSGKVIVEYASFADLRADVNGRSITLPSQYAGTYHAALGGYLYYHEHTTSNLHRVRASDGVLVNSRLVPTGSGISNQSQFGWGGFTDLAFYTDTGNRLWLLWGPSAAGNGKLALLDSDTMATIQTFDLPVRKNNMGFAFVAKGVVYWGNYDQPRILRYYDTNRLLYVQNVNNNLQASPGGAFLCHAAFNPARDELLTHDSNYTLVYRPIF